MVETLLNEYHAELKNWKLKLANDWKEREAEVVSKFTNIVNVLQGEITRLRSGEKALCLETDCNKEKEVSGFQIIISRRLIS